MPRPRLNPERVLTDAEKQAAYRQRQKAARLQELQAKGLPPLPAIATLPGTARWNGLIEQARVALGTARDEMQTYYDERSETWQESEKGQELQERIETIENAIDGLSTL